MALIKCPECGKYISDKAPNCINCGYPIQKESLTCIDTEFKKDDELNNPEKQDIEINLKDMEYVPNEKIQEKLEAEKERQERIIDEIEKSRIKEINARGGLLAWSIVWTIITIYIFGSSEIFIVISFFAAVGGWGFLFLTFSSVSQMDIDLKIAKEDFDKYEKQMQIRVQEAVKQFVREAEREHPICPNCRSNNTNRISDFNRVTSVTMLGIASSKIGKQYECKNCKFKW